jgi:lipopolysaccharide/colanic/teichoic acid biosynthesis glycosyltransferase
MHSSARGRNLTRSLGLLDMCHDGVVHRSTEKRRARPLESFGQIEDSLMTAASHEIHGHDVTFREWERSAADRYESIKTYLDVFLAAVLLVMLSPVILAAMVLVRLTSKGSAIYKQRRLGQNGFPFTIYKIRSMYLDSEVEGPRWSVPGDPRVTPLGHILRRSHIDELPQLVNVIRGEMSLIGPRPERPELITQLERALPHYRVRLMVRPGLSGLAQVLQPPDTDVGSVGRKLKYDIYYVDRISFFLDLRICIGTVLLFLCFPGRCIASLMNFPYERLDLEPAVQS